MMSIYIILAAIGGWGLAKMGEVRSQAKAEAESTRVTGYGEVKEQGEKDGAGGAPDTAPAPKGPVAAPDAVAGKTVPVPEPVKETPEPEPAKEDPAAHAPAPIGPPVLTVRTIPLAEVWVTDAAGARPVGLADLTGAFSISTLPAGTLAVEVRHADYRPMTSPLTVSLIAGEKTERLIMPEAKPGSLILLTDEGAIAYLDGKKVGGYAVMLGSVASKRDLPLKIVAADGTTRDEVVKLAPRENRLLDLRSPAKAKAEPVAVKSPANATAGDNAPAPAAPAPVAVRVVSAAADTGLIAFSSADGGAAPLAVGANGTLALPGIEAPVSLSCVRTFGGVSVCRATTPLPPVETPVAGVLTK